MPIYLFKIAIEAFYGWKKKVLIRNLVLVFDLLYLNKNIKLIILKTLKIIIRRLRIFDFSLLISQTKK